MTDRENIVRKIQALLSLADETGGGTEAECALAAARAQALMLKHRVEERELGSVNRSALPGVECVEVGVFPIGRFWYGDLLGSVGEPVAVTWHYVALSSATWRIHCVGRPDMIAYTRLVTDWIAPQLQYECDLALVRRKRVAADEWSPWGPGDTIRFRKSFYRGACARIRARLQEAMDVEPGTDLIISDRAAVDEFNERLGIQMVAHNRQIDVYAETEGDEAGGRVDIDPRNKIDRTERQRLSERS